MTALDALLEEIAQLQEDVKACDEVLELDPADQDAIETRAEVLSAIAELQAQIANERAKTSDTNATASLPPPPPPPPNPVTASFADIPPPPPSTSTSHGKSRGEGGAAEAEVVLFNVKDTVMAKYSADKQWYPATITTRTGSSADPVYYVSFKGYGPDTEKKYKHEVRAIDNRKRKIDGVSNVSSTPVSTNNGIVISAAASVDPTLVQKREPSRVGDGPTRLAPEPKKLKTSKALDKVQSSWKDFQAKGPKKVSSTMPKPKESQFRTADGGRGSGQPMKKDQARARWTYSGDGNDEE